MIYTFRADDGSEIEVEASMKKPPRLGAVRIREGKTYRRVLDIAPPLVMPDIRSKSHQLPTWYGFRNNKQADDYARSQGRKTTENDRNLIGRMNAERAGCSDQFDKQGRAIATGKSGIAKHIKRGRNMGDSIVFDGIRE